MTSAPSDAPDEERRRLRETREGNPGWRTWGPYLSERQWGTVREDYSPGGTAWESFPFDMARRRAYRWGEDGIAGICDVHQRLCFALALWNGRDPFLKDRMFGLSNAEGNHGEDVKEYYFHLDNVPSHAYMKMLYKYPQAAFPYDDLRATNRRRSKFEPEYELIDTGVFNNDAYFDVQVEYAKHAPDDILIRISITNRAAQAATVHAIPTLWFRNTWSWDEDAVRPSLAAVARDHIFVHHDTLGPYQFTVSPGGELLFTENETNFAVLYGVPNRSGFTKDGIDAFVVQGTAGAVNAGKAGTKAAARYELALEPGATATVRCRLTAGAVAPVPLGPAFDDVFAQRIREADAFYAAVSPFTTDAEQALVQRRAYAGLLWNKQYYGYVVRRWLDGDPTSQPPPASRLAGRNSDWQHFYGGDVLSMPDTWEFPWFAAWDLAFHALALATIDPDYAKQQLVLFTREWYMHPSGQLPAYEWSFDDVNPPVHAWAAYRVAAIEAAMEGCPPDRLFVERVFQKLLLNFTWWVNREDPQGNNVFGGGFLGLDNIGVLDRSALRDGGVQIGQADGTSWMGVYTLNLLRTAFELAQHDVVYEDMASKFFEHFLYIAGAINGSDDEAGLWDEADGFYYDVLRSAGGERIPMRVRSVVGLLPLLAVEVIEIETLQALPDFIERMNWFIGDRPDLARNIASPLAGGAAARRLISMVQPGRLRRLLAKMLDENEFLSPHGIRSLSKYHLEHPYELTFKGTTHRISYQPAESTDDSFGGNSNWRGPVWFPINYLIVEALQRFHYYLGDEFTVECPTGSGRFMTLWQVADDLSRRLISIFTKDANGRRPVFGGAQTFQTNPHWRDNVLFYEYYHGDNGAGIGASHQTGWSALVAKLIRQVSEYHTAPPRVQSAPDTSFATRS